MKRFAIASVLLAICFKTLGAEPSGTIEGRVALVGTPRPETKIDLRVHPEIEPAHPDGLTTRRYKVGEKNGLGNVLVYLRGDFTEREFKAPERPAVLEHVKGLFQPYVSGIQAGPPLELKNTDRCTFHAVATTNRAFSYSFTASCSFTNAEVPIKFKCDLHPWNYAYVGVFSHPYFTTTDNDGAFKIETLLPGRYTVEIFHPASGKMTKEVVVEGQRMVQVNFSVVAK